jgi:hypothetical protein
MGIQTDPEAYKKGYDDAMRAAAAGQAVAYPDRWSGIAIAVVKLLD